MKGNFRYEIPEGGWGILICIGASIPFATNLGCLPSFGLVFGDFLLSIGEETSAIAFITSSYFLSLSIAGLFSGSLFQRFGLRRVAIYGGLIYTLGSFLQIFVRSTLDLLVAFSLLQGIGFGLIIPAFYTIFNDYFVKKRVFWMGFAQTLIGILTMLYPIVMQALLEKYGFRGTLVILCAINAHAICGMQIFHPVKWHMRKVAIKDHELAEISEQPTVANQNNDNKQEQLASEAMHQNAPLMILNKADTLKDSDVKSISSSIISLGNWTGPVIVNDASPAMTRHHSVLDNSKISKIPGKSIWQMVVDFLDLGILKNTIYVNISLGISCALYADIAFFTLLSMYLFELGFTKHTTSRILALSAAADLLSRIVLALSAIFLKTSSRNIYLAGAFFSIICRYAFMEVSDFVGVVSLTAALGFLRTWVHVPLPLVFAEFLPKERFPTGYGLFMFMQGVITFAVGPIVGYLRDVTKSYIVTFHVLNAIMAICAIPWLLEYAYLKFIKKQKINIPMKSNIRTEQNVD